MVSNQINIESGDIKINLSYGAALPDEVTQLGSPFLQINPCLADLLQVLEFTSLVTASLSPP